MWADLLPVGRDGTTGGYRRHRLDAAPTSACREWFAGEAARRGLDLVVDRNGNQWAWWGDPDADGPGVVTGSHLDSVPDGGAYDGPLGVGRRFAADRPAARRAGVVPARPIGGGELHRRGGRAVRHRLRRVAAAHRRARRRPGAAGSPTPTAPRWPRPCAPPGTTRAPRAATTRRCAGSATLVELHVEQGRGLVDLGAPVGVAHGIWPHGRWRLDLTGEANHAGTTRLVDRDDPMLRLAAAVLAAREAATARGAVATIGRVDGRAQRHQRDPLPDAGPGSTPAAPTRPTCRAVVAEVAAAAGSRAGRGVLDTAGGLRRRPPGTIR